MDLTGDVPGPGTRPPRVLAPAPPRARDDTVAVRFTGREALSVAGMEFLSSALHPRHGAVTLGVVGDEHVVSKATGVNPAGIFRYHEVQSGDACAAQAANSFFGRHVVSFEQLVRVREEAAREAGRIGSVTSTYGASPDELDKVLETNGETAGTKVEKISLHHTKIVDKRRTPFFDETEWMEANREFVAKVLCTGRFIVAEPGHFTAIHQVKTPWLSGHRTVYVVVDSMARGQMVTTAAGVVTRIIQREASRFRGNSLDEVRSGVLFHAPADPPLESGVSADRAMAAALVSIQALVDNTETMYRR